MELHNALECSEYKELKEKDDTELKTLNARFQYFSLQL